MTFALPTILIHLPVQQDELPIRMCILVMTASKQEGLQGEDD
jgi:hypothetical protein